jgi:hypothetical protein
MPPPNFLKTTITTRGGGFATSALPHERKRVPSRGKEHEEKKVNEREDKEGDRIAGGLPVWSQKGEEILESIREHVLYYRDPTGIVALGQAALGKGDARRIAFYDLVRILHAFLSQLVQWVEEKEQGELHQLAGQALAHIIGELNKREKELSAANQSYRAALKKISPLRPEVFFPKSKISRVVRRELFTALEMRKTLVVIKASRRDVEQRGWESKELLAAFDKVRARLVPREYLPFEKLRPFSSKSEPRWWEFLWPLLQKKIAVSKMPPLKAREYDTGSVSYNSRSGRMGSLASGKKTRKRYHSDLETQCRKVFRRLARMRSEGLL